MGHRLTNRLQHGRGAHLDGTPAEPVDDEAKELATKQLAKLAARNAAKQTAAAKAKPKPKPVSVPETPAQLRSGVCRLVASAGVATQAKSRLRGSCGRGSCI
jgi:hypothetical protein